jgi:glucan phosphoethanolaminetransferase (alkaline phosphatase superfamily)
MAFRFPKFFKQSECEKVRLNWKDWRSWRDWLNDCWNYPTILLAFFLLASIWVLRTYGLEHPIENVPFMEEWGLEVWVILDAILFFLILRIGGWFRYVSLAFVSFWGTVHITSAKIYGDLLHYGQIASAMETTDSEAAGYLQFLGFFPLFVFIGLFILLLALTWKTSKTGWLGAIIFVCVSFAPIAELAVPALLGDRYSQSYELIRFPAEKMKDRYINSLVYRLPTMVGQYFSIKNRMLAAGGKVRTLPEGVTAPVTADDAAIPKRIIIILGESDWRKHHGVYGYPYGTDHFMMAQVKDPAHAAYFMALTSSAVTREAVPRIMTFATARDITPFIDNMGVLDMAKHAGYQTGWYSRQNMSGLHDTLVKIVAQQAEKAVYFDYGRDDVLVDPVVKAFNDGKQMFVLHTWGGHMWYEDRHDEVDYQRASRSPEESRHYDAAISHIDRMQEQITAHGDNNTLFIYIPDHGEILNLGHGTADMRVGQFEVPFYAWSKNPVFVSRFRESVKRFSIQDGKLFNTSAFAFVMAEMMGYQVSDAARQKSLEESNYVFNVDGHAYPLSDINYNL